MSDFRLLEDVQAQAPDAARLALARGRHERREGHPDRRERHRAAVLGASSTASSTSGRARRARTCRASRRSSTTRSARSCSASGSSAPRRWRSTSPRRCATARARAAPRCASRRATRSTSRRPSRASETQELYTLLGTAVASEAGTRRLIGVRAQGITACPCAQGLVQAQLARAAARRRLLRGRGRARSSRPSRSPPTTSAASARCYVGCPEDCATDIDAERLLAIVEESMSSEIYELMKRSDEGAVVEKAHRRPRFVEDCVRESVRGVIDGFAELTDRHFVSPARRTWRRSTSTTSSPSASACSASCAARRPQASTPSITSRRASGSTAAREPARRKPKK